MKGTVKFFNKTKGYGFIKEAETDKEWFVHVSGLVDKIADNDNVEFEIDPNGKKGPCAVNVKKVTE
jgi:CspA family cold shock protein